MMHIEHGLSQQQTQRQQLSPQMQQGLQILHATSVELVEQVYEELDTNEALEIVEPDPREGQDAALSDGQPDTNGSDSTDLFEEPEFDLDSFSDRWDQQRQDAGPTQDGPTDGASDVNQASAPSVDLDDDRDWRAREGRDLSRNPDADERRDYYQDSITQHEESLVSHLLTQLRWLAPDEQTTRIGERIIGEIDRHGRFTGSVAEIAQEFGVDESEVERALKLIQQFEPIGVGARDLAECYLIQIAVEHPEEEELRTLVGEHFDDLAHRQIPKIARAMRTTPERVLELLDLLRRLDPYPGHEYSSESARPIAPDVIVEWSDDLGDYDVYLANDNIPELRVSPTCRRIVKSKNRPAEERKYYREKVESAKWLIRSIRQRRSTIERVARAIVEVQREFLEKGKEHLKPLTLQEIADKVEVHEATVSRTTRGKYMQTPQGLFEMKYFFSPGLSTDDGGAQSSKSVQAMIKKLIDEEDKRRPLSDQAIANRLKEQGIKVARRTVTKYREGLGISPTNIRRQY